VARISIIGAGVMGCATAWALSDRGEEVTLVEQFEPGHAQGSSHGRTRIVRLAYPDPAWVELAEEALEGWRDFEREAERELLGLYGLVELCSSVELTSRDVLGARGIEHRLLRGRELRELGVTLPGDWVALWQAEAGVVYADRAVEALLEAARRRGVRLQTGRRVESLDEIDADVVVVTAGAWVTRLVPDVPVHVTRETVAYFNRPGSPAPAIVELNEATRGHAMYALYDPVHGLKAGAHHVGHEADPDAAEAADPQLVARIVDWVRARLPEIDPEPAAVETCLYTNTDDESFVLERHGRVVIGSACSGHGFKFAPVVGRRLAELALGRG
jgi:sarcosine oxidase